MSSFYLKGDKKVSKIFLTGATGFVGRAILRMAQQQGHQVICAVRKPTRPNEVFFDLTDDAIKPDFKQCDIVIHSAARVHIMDEQNANAEDLYQQANVNATVSLARNAAKEGVKRFVFLSSIKVNGEYSNPQTPFTEDDLANPSDSYSQSKLEAELALLALAKEVEMEVVIVRPPLVYGPGVKANFANLMRAIQKGIPLPLGSIHNKRSLIYVDNLADFVLMVAHHPLSANQIFLVSDMNDVSTSKLVVTLKKALKSHCMILPIPQFIMTGMLTILGKKEVALRLFSSLQIDSNKLEKQLGWVPPYTFQDGIQKTAEFYLNNLNE